jgi:ferrochelatase
MASANALLLLNLGTPDAPEPAALKRYLAQFLMDPDVIDLPWPARWLLVHGMILRTRPASSAALYRKIWRPEGSPLLINTLALADGVRARLGDAWAVEAGMRYGSPSIGGALERLAGGGARAVKAIPLFPQYSEAASGSAIRECRREAARLGLEVSFLESFHERPGFVRQYAALARRTMAEARAEAIVFSFHGLPESQIRKFSEGQCNLVESSSCCSALGAGNLRCYRAQCFETARALARELGVAPALVGFQSRLGRAAWIRPYLDEVLAGLLASGVRRVAVACPAFVSDCLETLEEIGIRAREDFLRRGGEELALVPSLNAEPAWVEEVAQMAGAMVS